jgi:Zn-dependent peptidase ImmA (M78 family)/transcriptional regulator with XRE-family HTH domain
MEQGDAVDEVGKRVAEARHHRGLTQTDLGNVLGLDKTQVSKIESGRRRLDISEVVLAAQALGVTTRQLLGMPERTKLALAGRLAVDAPDGAMRPAMTRARHLVEIDDALSQSAELQPAVPTDAAKSVLAHGRELGRRAVRSKKTAQQQGKELAELVRQELDLGADALADLPGLIETYFGVDVALSPLGTHADGLCVHSSEISLILASSSFPAGHVRFTLAHELGHHLLGDPREVIGEATTEMFADDPLEWRANAFAGHLLVPEAGAIALLRSRQETGPISAPSVLALMTHFQVSFAALIYQLNQLDLLSYEDGADLKARGVNNLVHAYGEVESARCVLDPPATMRRPPSRLKRVALEAFAAQQIGLGPVASLLERDDEDALYRELMDDYPADDESESYADFLA